jgi:cell division septum initiation protein DivIVA
VSIIDQIADDRDKAQQENKQLKDRIKHLEAALRRIANQDYRGNRSTESQIAAEALKP